MFVAKPHRFGEVVAVTAQGQVINILDLATADSAKLLQQMDHGLYANPDGAGVHGLSAVPGSMQGVPGLPTRTGNVSGRGTLNVTARTTAPMSNPYGASSNSVRTSPWTIAK